MEMLRRRKPVPVKAKPGNDEGKVTLASPSTTCVKLRGASNAPGLISRIRRCLWVTVQICLVVILLPPFLNYVSLVKEEQYLKPVFGELYDIGWGQKLFLSCNGTGQPTVVLDAPTGSSSDAWHELAPMLAKLTRVCVYDRAGLGFSERPVLSANVSAAGRVDEQLRAGSSSEMVGEDGRRSQPYTVERMAEDLHRLITQSSQQHPPFVLVGSGLGALVAKFYAHFYADVAAVVLVDPPVDKLFADEQWVAHWFDSVVPSAQALQLLAATGVARLALLTGLMNAPDFANKVAYVDPLFAARQKFLMCYPRHLKTAVDEHYLMNETLLQMKILGKVKPFPGNVSVTLVTSPLYDETTSYLNSIWRDSYKDAKLSLNIPVHATTVSLQLNGATNFYDSSTSKKLRKLIADVIASTRNRQVE